VKHKCGGTTYLLLVHNSRS